MKRDDDVSWSRLGRIEKVFLVLMAIWALLYFTGMAQKYQTLAGVAAVCMGVAAIVKIGRMALRNLIWRLRNRLIVAYLFIAVVPIVLILALMLVTSYTLVGQIAVYMVQKDLDNRISTLKLRAEALTRAPARDPQRAMQRTLSQLKSSFPVFEMLSTGEQEFRYPPDSKLSAPPELPGTSKNESGLITKLYGDTEFLFAWAHSEQGGNEVTILAPITAELLSGLVEGIGDIGVLGYTRRAAKSNVPAAANALDFGVSFAYPVFVPSWESPQGPPQKLYLFVDTRYSAVLGIVFGQKADWSDVMMTSLLVLISVFLLVEMVSLRAGVKLTRAITGAVHELYEGTQHVREGDFSYRIPVKGADQIAELAGSFNTMTQNLGRLIVVAKEKERLESELAIARDVQNQLFPKDVPFTKSLELKGVCSPARMVSGDYYDFMALPNDGLAFAIGDVAGKGISAALLMATIQSTMRTQLSTANGNPLARLSAAKMVATLNRQLYATTSPEKYATFFFALYDEDLHALTYTNAGHLAPILLRGNDIQMLDSTGTVVGAFPASVYEEKTVALEQGDVLLAYTDGIVEPENVYGEMFGDERLKDLLVKYARTDSAELIARTMEAVVHWTGAGELQDDMTMVVARRL
ncbi:MAG: SpoIIE family protein phosphatase [Candidatus Solibacter sp.]|nr:SpoIIE family protein phosphatase [Candidatus Solibacter sp.]